mmetsp:Transcript_36364/g.107338  ORF Transcript_36364/g.107338 Transcript_36364/m.107338 type:complete len:264 (+) Transcript_36364:322-1113(+)
MLTGGGGGAATAAAASAAGAAGGPGAPPAASLAAASPTGTAADDDTAADAAGGAAGCSRPLRRAAFGRTGVAGRYFSQDALSLPARKSSCSLPNTAGQCSGPTACTVRKSWVVKFEKYDSRRDSRAFVSESSRATASCRSRNAFISITSFTRRSAWRTCSASIFASPSCASSFASRMGSSSKLSSSIRDVARLVNICPCCSRCIRSFISASCNRCRASRSAHAPCMADSSCCSPATCARRLSASAPRCCAICFSCAFSDSVLW